MTHRDDWDQMISDWETDFAAGTHNFFVSQKED
jgi:hypothetical protein